MYVSCARACMCTYTDNIHIHIHIHIHMQAYWVACGCVLFLCNSFIIQVPYYLGMFTIMIYVFAYLILPFLLLLLAFFEQPSIRGLWVGPAEGQREQLCWRFVKMRAAAIDISHSPLDAIARCLCFPRVFLGTRGGRGEVGDGFYFIVGRWGWGKSRCGSKKQSTDSFTW